MALSKEEKRERERKRREEWDAEIARLHKRQEQRSIDPSREKADKRNADLLEQIHKKILSSEFKAWYEATTGCDVTEFTDEYVISREDFLRKFDGKYGHQIDWTRRAIERVVESNPWTNPETRAYWTDEVIRAVDYVQRRKALLRLGTPKWASREKVLEIYVECQRISIETGIQHHVDHIIPIVHPDVCGLHCEFNLRIIPAEDNRAKSNLFNGVSRRIRKSI